ncbi:excinuclease ABC subunit UvrA [Paenibacillus methanolicus]|uniref:UvrABC system protein A n=1 Tax=Paenibacillus methanolicus TaxID=582686 RepID=A0A5S5CDZ4_9BACL|nr:excinuclease ABC subunit UvrA [Paenibacillus methanolicus]TYP76536.1 excinuclease ABC subunit A [Paenibacillus methanolicus]
MDETKYIELLGVTERNLKHVDFKVPKRRLSLITGVSGSGKSTLLFDVLCKESERQHLLAVGRVAEQVQRPQFKEAKNLAPVVAVSQRRTNPSPRSTLGTYSEIYTHLRILYLSAGDRPCPACGARIPGGEADGRLSCPACSADMMPLTLAHLSFNTPLGACEACGGLGEELHPDPEKLLDFDASIAGGGMLAWKKGVGRFFELTLVQAAKHYGLAFAPEDMGKPIGELPELVRELLLYGTDDERLRRLRPELAPPKTAEAGRFEGAVPAVRRRYFEQTDEAARESSDLKPLMSRRVCIACGGSRLNAVARGLSIGGASIDEVTGLSLDRLRARLEAWDRVFANTPAASAVKPLLHELLARLQSLADVGLSYLTLDRPMSSLSGGEAQRVRLASSLHSSLTDIVFVYDEPTSGLHPKDIENLYRALLRQRDRGNTVIVVEHQLQLAKLADHIVEVGPGAGAFGGRIVVQGGLGDILRCEHSLTRRYLKEEEGRSRRDRAPFPNYDRCLTVKGASQRNLKGIDAVFPLGALTAVTGVSGSGKTTLMFDALLPAVKEGRMTGSGLVERVVVIDQDDMGRSARSNAATYTGLFDDVRDLFAKQARTGGYAFKPSHFSFNVKGGRCEHCLGLGATKTNMYFMPDAYVPCAQCGGKRYLDAVLQVTYRGYSIARILEASLQEAAAIFDGEPAIRRRLEWLLRLGLGYLPLGQPAHTLSGGEARRIQLAKELQRTEGGHALIVLDEPSTGLHPQDADLLGDAIEEIVRRGNTAIMIEHKSRLIRRADWVVELGPEGGERGGYLLSQGTVSRVREEASSQIGPYL